MKLRKDIQKNYQKDLVDVIGDQACSHLPSKCVVSNPDMKGKMRRIDCLRQSDKVWRLDLVMVVLFKGVPLESSDGERLDKLSECAHPQLCINPNHALLNVRDLEVYLANYINTRGDCEKSGTNGSCVSNGKIFEQLSYSKNIVSPSVFTSQEFLALSEIAITQGATECDLKSENLKIF